MDAALQDAFRQGLVSAWEDGTRATCREGDYCDPLELGFMFGDDDDEVEIHMTFELEDGKYYVYWLYIWGSHGVVEFWADHPPKVSRKNTDMAVMHDMVRLVYQFLAATHTPKDPLVAHCGMDAKVTGLFFPINTDNIVAMQ